MDLIAERFRIDGEPLGRGSTGVVWPATDVVTGRAVAVKVLHPELVGDPATLARLQDAASAAGRLTHPHVVQVVGLWSDGPGRWVLVTERVEGRALQDVGGPLAPSAVAALGFELASALEAAHLAGLVHGDVRPGNVLVGTGGARLFDFGSDLIHPGQTAPEVVDGAPRGPAADLYGLGLVLWFAMSGQMPFEGVGAAPIAAQRRGPPSTQDRGGLWQLARLLLHPDPARRPTDLASIRAALARLRADPHRRLRLRRPLASFRMGRQYVVHGIDPGTGARALVATDLSRRSARRLLRHLRGQGWQVAAHPEALGWGDLALIGASTLVFGVLLPLVGAPLGAWLAWRYGTARTFPGLRRALPPLSVPLPPRELPAGAETAVVAGLLLLVAGLLLGLQTWAAVVPLALLVALAGWSWGRRAADPAGAAEAEHVRTALAETRWLIDHHAGGLDEALALTGEVGELEGAWLEGTENARRVLARLDGITEGLRHSTGDRSRTSVVDPRPTTERPG
ncbi:MAG: serine/threonine protein kinase [Alphaproteobacteria bacterium]|nr:serine/threonine protein kinase [Alphaproteobacteria bacterium]